MCSSDHIDADGKYIRGVEGENTDISVWSNRWSTMPVHAFPRLSLARPDSRADLDNMPGSDVPANRSPPTTWQTVPSSRQAGRREPGRNSTTPPTPGNRTTWSTHSEPTTTQNCSATPSPRSRPPRSSWSASASAEANGGRGIRAASAGGRHQGGQTLGSHLTVVPGGGGGIPFGGVFGGGGGGSVWGFLGGGGRVPRSCLQLCFRGLDRRASCRERV